MNEVARDYAVSGRWVHMLVRHYEAERDAAFEPRSRRPHSNVRRVGDTVEDAVVAQEPV
ncbi:MAG: hypothetical protein M3N95_01020 [Actinomycetota bacterium]|nr:hypothetical protein [Actinomycetota bacterium]